MLDLCGFASWSSVSTTKLTRGRQQFGLVTSAANATLSRQRVKQAMTTNRWLAFPVCLHFNRHTCGFMVAGSTCLESDVPFVDDKLATYKRSKGFQSERSAISAICQMRARNEH